MNFIACINNNHYYVKLSLRKYTRLKKNETMEFPEWLQEIIDKCI
jgi:hypothetical protein